MEPERWRRVQELFHETRALPTGERRGHLEQACGADVELAREVVALVEEDERASVLDAGVGAVAHGALGEAPPLEIGPYRLVRTIGEGGMGVVYLAERGDLGSRAAVKVLRHAWLSPARRERFEEEQRTLAQLEHPLIARLYDADTLEDGTPWFAMEYVEGVPITQHCFERGAPLEERLGLFRRACEAVVHAHRRAVVHRDLKPSNLLVKADGSLRLLDFGIAKQLGGEPRDATRTGFRYMTPAYAAPEQLKGEPVGLYTDVYALGVVLHELLTGRRPFDRPDLAPAEREALVLGTDAERPSVVARRAREAGEARPAVASRRAWADLDVLCLTALQRPPERRYASVEALARDVDHFLAHQPLEARPDSLGYVLGKFTRRNRVAVVSAALAVALVAGVVGAFTWRLSRARDAALVEATRAQRIQAFMDELLQGGDAEWGPGKDLTVLAMVERGAKAASLLDDEPEVQADLFANLGSTFGKLGQYERAEALLSMAVERRRALRGATHPSVGETLSLLGGIKDKRQQVEEAVRLTKEGLELLERGLPPAEPRIAVAKSRLGSALVTAGRYHEGVKVLDEAIALQSTGGPPSPALLETKGVLANAQFYLGDFARSEALNRELLAAERALRGEHHPSVADSLINLGAIEMEGGHPAEAERYDREALSAMRAFYGEEHVETGGAMTVLAQALSAQGKFEEAEALMREALGVLERGYGPDHPRVALLHMELGNNATRKKAWDESAGHFAEAERIYRKANPKHFNVGAALMNRGILEAQRGRTAEAEPLLRQALENLRETLPAGHIRVGKTQVSLGRVLVRLKRHREAEAELLAGWANLMKQPTPPVKWLKGAVEDLEETYQVLGEPARAGPYRAAFAELEEKEAAARP